MTMPASPRFSARLVMMSPMMAVVTTPPASTTMTSPGAAMSMALCTIRLSPGVTFTVRAGPQSFPPLCIGRSAAPPATRRFMLSERCAVTIAASALTSFLAGRAGMGRMRKPILGMQGLQWKIERCNRLENHRARSRARRLQRRERRGAQYAVFHVLHIARLVVHLDIGLPLRILLHLVAFLLALGLVGVGPEMDHLVERPDFGGGEYHRLAQIAQLDGVGVFFVHGEPGVLHAGLERIDAQIENHRFS